MVGRVIDQERNTITDVASAMNTQRPVQLDLLDVFVGQWDWEGEGDIAGLDKPARFSGIRESRWEGDRWYLVTRETGTMEGYGESKTLTVWSYDALANLFRTSYVDSAGTTMIGTAQYDEASSSWTCSTKSHGPTGTTSAEGRIRFPSRDLMEWDWTENDTNSGRQTMYLSGVCRRTSE